MIKDEFKAQFQHIECLSRRFCFATNALVQVDSISSRPWNTPMLALRNEEYNEKVCNTGRISTLCCRMQ